MVTFAEALTNRAQKWCVIVQIDAVGPWYSSSDLTALDNDARTRFCTQIPDYADVSTGGWLSTLVGDPDLLGEMPDPLGGDATDDGALEFGILDKDNYLTDLIRPEATPVTALNGDHTAADTTVDVLSASGLTDTDTIFVGSEAMRISSISSLELTLSRGYLGTDPVSHDSNDAVFLYTTYLTGRRATLKIVPKDGDDSGEEEVEVEGVITRWAWDPLCNIWRFSVRTQSEYLDRVAPSEPRSVRVFNNGKKKAEEQGRQPAPGQENVILVENADSNVATTWAIWAGNTGNAFHVKSNRGEVVGVLDAGSPTVIRLRTRAMVGTRQEEIGPGDRLYQVFLSDPTYGEGDFRFSPGGTPSTDRTSGTWTQTAHFCDICRIIMTSSSGADDDLGITNNYLSARGNFASLPAGFGLGIPSNSTTNLIDHDSWEDVKARTLDITFPNFIYGDEPVPFLELISENFLKPLGAYIVFRSGTAKIVLPRIPLTGYSDITLGSAAFLKRAVAPGVYEPRINQLDMDVSRHSGSVIFELGPQERQLIIKSGTYQNTFGQRGHFGDADKPVKVKVPAADPSADDTWIRVGEGRLFRRHRPRLTIDADFDFGTAYPAEHGDVAAVTLPEIPDLNGARGITSARAEIEEREPVMQRDNFFVRLKMRSYGQGLKVGRICPAASIDSHGGTTATVLTNRFTQSDATGGLPTTDAAAFTVGDFVRQVAPDGTDSGGSVQEISTISGNDIELDSAFSGGFTDGHILVYAIENESSATQTSNYAYMADRDALGTGSETPFVYGEN